MKIKEWLKKDSYKNLFNIIIGFFVCLAIAVIISELVKANKTEKRLKEIATQIAENKSWEAYTYTTDKTTEENVYFIHFYYERKVGQYIRTYVVNIDTGDYVVAGEE